jgi:hypothetical protein
MRLLQTIHRNVAAIDLAVANPIPRLEPVIRTTLPVSLRSMS